jgi:hypothetical protein
MLYFFYLCFSSLICAAERTAEMSEIKDTEGGYLILRESAIFCQ